MFPLFIMIGLGLVLMTQGSSKSVGANTGNGKQSDYLYGPDQNGYQWSLYEFVDHTWSGVPLDAPADYQTNFIADDRPGLEKAIDAYALMKTGTVPFPVPPVPPVLDPPVVTVGDWVPVTLSSRKNTDAPVIMDSYVEFGLQWGTKPKADTTQMMRAKGVITSVTIDGKYAVTYVEKVKDNGIEGLPLPTVGAAFKLDREQIADVMPLPFSGVSI